ncbi:MAG: M1 family aminopeptidase [Nitrospinaceae bacterium]|nr:M1 family aminopeptidase [Nitrospinaceae bacterium]
MEPKTPAQGDTLFPFKTILFLIFFTASPAFAETPPTHHELTATLPPSQSVTRFHDVVTIPKSIARSISGFHLNKNSKIEQIAISGKKVSFDVSADGFIKLDLTQHLANNLTDPIELIFDYSLSLPIADDSQETLFISGADFFYPQSESKSETTGRLTFQLTVHSPASLRAVSQGEKLKDFLEDKNRTVVWKEENPQEEILLVADQYHVFSEHHGLITLYAYLRDDDKALAERYFSATRTYLDLYSRLFAPYPYKKFALVENSQQTGYGMPSFTLLGSRVIRFPFILHTSYPHEILHNWFGNGVYIDSNSGNWAEGLTTYLADHLLPEQKGKGDRYRFQQLIKYSSYVNATNDFPLVEFKGRDSMASQAVGYGKTLMVLHMLRVEVGDALFLESLRDFYNRNQFQLAGFNDLQISFERVSKRDLKDFFNQWTERKGAPQLKLSSASHSKQNGEHLLALEIRQTQSDLVFKMKLPIAVWLKDREKPVLKNIDLAQRKHTFALPLSSQPLKVILDPYHEVFRWLNPGEVPPSIGQTYGAETQTAILRTTDGSSDVLKGYHHFAKSLGKSLSDNLNTQPPAGSLWVFGKDNKFSDQLKIQLNRYGVKMGEQGVALDHKIFPWENHSFIFTLNRPDSNRDTVTGDTVTWLIASSAESIPGLIRKLPHYGKYGYLVFQGSVPDNAAKGRWPSSGAGLHHIFKKGAYSLPSQTPLIKP